MNPGALDWKRLITSAYDLALPGCRLCARDCDAPRSEDAWSAGAWCRSPLVPHINTQMVHMGEEQELRPSHTIFFAGCNAKCSFCHAWEFAQDSRNGVKASPEALAALIEQTRDDKGARNVNFVGGESTLYLPYIFETLSRFKKPHTVVWNSNFYYRTPVADLLAEVVDIYLADYKFGNDRCALQLGGFVDYTNVLDVAFDVAYKANPMIIRHLLMPGHLDCCTQPTLDKIVARWPNAKLSMMTHYLPMWKAADGVSGPDMARPATPDEAGRATAMAKASGLVLA